MDEPVEAVHVSGFLGGMDSGMGGGGACVRAKTGGARGFRVRVMSLCLGAVLCCCCMITRATFGTDLLGYGYDTCMAG